MKQGALHREWSLWNQLILGQSSNTSSPVGGTASAFSGATENINSDTAVASQDEKQQSEESEKAIAAYSPYPPNLKETEFKTFCDFLFANKVKLIKYMIIIFNIYSCVFFLLRNPYHLNFHPSPATPGYYQEQNPEFSLHNVVDSIPSIYEANATEPHEVIDIPLMPYSNVSSPVYSTKLLNHTFALSWSKPALVTYSPPPANITYNRIVLTLDTTVQGVQYDRLLHVYLNDNEVWRSSTIEPAGKLSHSYAQKDVTIYSSLFKEEGNLLVQLDNLVTPKLIGAFNVTINALFFNDLEGSEETQGHFGGKNFSLPSIVPLTSSRIGGHVPPIVYYPDSPLSNIELPTINYNTTKVALLLTTSGNAAEEFWFSNIVDQYKDYFLSHDRHFYGHGSCRVINVYVNGIRVHSTNPKPYVFTGGVAPTLWNPIVSTGSFDLVPYFIDLSPILPLLWESPASLLDIEITNCIDDDEKSVVKSGIGSNWITSASLAVWEDEAIDDSFGTLESADNSTAVKSFAIAPPFSGMLTQILKATYKNSLSSNVTYVYKNGTQSTSIKSFENSANQTSLIFVTKFGDSQSDLSILKSNSSVSFLDPSSLTPIKDFTMLSNNTLKNKLNFLPAPSDSADADISFNTNITVKFDLGLYSDLSPNVEIKSKENGTADFTISSAGNYGTGSTLHNYTLTKADGYSYSRVALADNGTIVYDNITETVSSVEETGDLAYTTLFSSFSDIEKLNWLTVEELNEIESFFDEQETSDFVSTLLHGCHSS